jgi:hypothetical protein
LFVSLTKLESPKKKRPIKLTLNVLQNANLTYDIEEIYSEDSASQIFIQTKKTEDSSKRKIKKNIYPEFQISKKTNQNHHFQYKRKKDNNIKFNKSNNISCSIVSSDSDSKLHLNRAFHDIKTDENNIPLNNSSIVKIQNKKIINPKNKQNLESISSTVFNMNKCNISENICLQTLKSSEQYFVENNFDEIEMDKKLNKQINNENLDISIIKCPSLIQMIVCNSEG